MTYKCKSNRKYLVRREVGGSRDERMGISEDKIVDKFISWGACRSTAWGFIPERQKRRPPRSNRRRRCHLLKDTYDFYMNKHSNRATTSTLCSHGPTANLPHRVYTSKIFIAWLTRILLQLIILGTKKLAQKLGPEKIAPNIKH